MKKYAVVSLFLIQMCLLTSIGFAQTDSEIEFWQSVKASNDVDMLNAYLQEYPDGKFKSIAILKIKKLGGTVTSSKTTKTEVNPSATTIMSNKKWCGRSGSASEMSPQDCLDSDGVPVPNKEWADWMVNSYFGKYKEHKAFAVSNDSWGASAKAGNPAVAKRQALYDCNLRANMATSCRVINVNGERTTYSDYSKSSDPAFSASGKLSEIAGRYKLLLEGGSSEWEGILKLNVNGSDIQGTLKVCARGLSMCALYAIKKIHEKKKRLAGLNEHKQITDVPAFLQDALFS